MERKPFFSVIIPTYNRERLLGRAIKSVLKQTCTDYELIVVDDGSKDRTAKVVNSFGSQVQYIVQKNRGPSEARNTGIRAAKGIYIAFLDSDDQFIPDKLKINKQFLESHPECQFLYSWYYSVRRGHKKRTVRSAKSYADLNKFRFHLLDRSFTIRTSTAVVHRSCFDKVGMFNPTYRYSQDWDMWLRLAHHYNGFCLKMPLVLYRKHSRRKIPSNYRHLKIRRTACNLYRWNMRTLRSFKAKYRARRSFSRIKKLFRNI